jgi:glycosyltransferase involved in cell wall biosynthesis
MIRIGFVVFDYDGSWVGGINYLSNLLHAIAKIDDRQIEPVLIVSPTTSAKLLSMFPPWQVLQTELLGSQNLYWRLISRFLHRDVLMERFLKRNNINLLSHSGPLGLFATVPTIGWIPDFQHRRIPEFFSLTELMARDRGYFRITKQCTTVLLSSSDARNDLAKFDPLALRSSRVLSFVAGFAGGAITIVDEESLRVRHGIVGPYLHLPNQFWVHKNHRLVVDALALLRARGRQLLVVCTGHTEDHRWPKYYEELMQHASEQGVAGCFKVLGLVHYKDMISLMKYSVAVINPSLFEGWSTTIEEAKSLGLTVVLSDIPVHREQNPNRGVFFDPDKPDSLADALLTVSERHNPEVDATYQEQAKASLLSRFSLFGTEYQAIALETFSRFNSNL